MESKAAATTVGEQQAALIMTKLLGLPLHLRLHIVRFVACEPECTKRMTLCAKQCIYPPFPGDTLPLDCSAFCWRRCPYWFNETFLNTVPITASVTLNVTLNDVSPSSPQGQHQGVSTKKSTKHYSIHSHYFIIYRGDHSQLTLWRNRTIYPQTPEGEWLVQVNREKEPTRHVKTGEAAREFCNYLLNSLRYSSSPVTVRFMLGLEPEHRLVPSTAMVRFGPTLLALAPSSSSPPALQQRGGDGDEQWFWPTAHWFVREDGCLLTDFSVLSILCQGGKKRKRVEISNRQIGFPSRLNQASG